MNKLFKPKNSIKVYGLRVENIEYKNAKVIEDKRKHRHYLIALKSGKANININGIEKKINENQCMILVPNNKYIIKLEDGEFFETIIFDGVIEDNIIKNKIITLGAKSSNVYKDLFSLSDEKNCELMLSGLQYFLTVLKTEQLRKDYFSDDTAIFYEALNYMKENLDKDLSISNIAAYLCVSSSKFKRVFKKHSLLSVHKYLLTLKTEAAKEMLLEGVSSKMVSKKLGFENQNYFSAVFKRETGESPSNFKRQNT